MGIKPPTSCMGGWNRYHYATNPYSIYLWEPTHNCLPVKQARQITLFWADCKLYLSYWILGQSWKDDSARQMSNTNYATATRNANSYGSNWQNVYNTKQNTHWIEVGYNKLKEVGSWNARRDIRFLTLIGPNKHGERGRVSLIGYHLTVQ